jgi:1-acyl-sn-glycerol-3-phosphate acyltransferase
MAKSFADRSSDLAFFVLRPAIELWMRAVAKRSVSIGPGVDFKRREPFVLLANHSFAMDVVHVPLPFRITPQIVASRDMFVNPFERFVLSYVARCIMAPKGGGDLRTVKELIRAVAAGYPVLLFPEGDISFFGRSGELPKAVAMLVRKLGLDVITCRVAGGYLSAPRWAKAARGRRAIGLRYELAITAAEAATLSLAEIHERIASRLEHDEYAAQRSLMAGHPAPRGAEGLEDVLYVCPACRAIASMAASGNELSCLSCGAKGSLDEYGFLHGWAYDNPADWDRFQKGLSEDLRRGTFSSSGVLYVNDYRALKQRKLGAVQVEYRDSKLRFNGVLNREFAVEELADVALTMRANLNFSCEGVDYILKLDRLALAFLRASQDRY